MKNKKLKPVAGEVVENMMLDTTRLRAALLLACIELTGDPMDAFDLAEHFYDLAPDLIEHLTEDGLSNLPGGPAKIVQFPNKPKV